MASVDYVTIALITIFTSFFAGIGQELAKEIIKHVKHSSTKIRKNVKA